VSEVVLDEVLDLSGGDVPLLRVNEFFLLAKIESDGWELLVGDSELFSAFLVHEPVTPHEVDLIDEKSTYFFEKLGNCLLLLVGMDGVK
jgi:hypothetical protein